MLSEIVLSKSLNTIVFENRNQNYGAFYLRNEYEKHILKAFGYILLFIALLSAISFLSQFNKNRTTTTLTQPIVQVSEVKFERKIEFEKPKVNVTHQPQSQQLGRALPTRISNQQTIEPVTPNPTLPSTIGDPLGTLKTPSLSVVIPQNSSVGGDNEKHKVYNEFGVEKMAEFPGGEEAMQEYLGKHIHFTNSAKDNQIEGKVVINFIIDEDGRIVDCKVLRSLGFGLDEIALEAIRNMPTWKPAEQSDRKVPVSFTMPIQFTLSY